MENINNNKKYFAGRKNTDACLFVFLLLFFRGDRIDSVVLKYRERTHSKGN